VAGFDRCLASSLALLGVLVGAPYAVSASHCVPRKSRAYKGRYHW
jgi:hypothetical protein